MDIGHRIRELREAQELTVRVLSDRTGLAENSIARIERGERIPSATSVEAIARGLGVAPGELFEEPVAPLGEAPGEEAGLTDEEIRRIQAGLVVPGTTSEADMKKLLRYDRGQIIISALEELCDYADLVLSRGGFYLEEIASLEELMAGQYYSHKYDPRREEVLQWGTPQQKAALKQEEARMNETLNALKAASLRWKKPLRGKRRGANTQRLLAVR